MCGIVAYIGQRNINEVLINSLSKLEYRGYDSAGIAAIEEDRLRVVKESGKLSELRDLLQKQPFHAKSQIGIGHTRWATHGKPNRENAHPHTSYHGGKAVVHNGIIENHDSVRADLEENGYHFSSDTDTEVIIQLIDQITKNQQLPLQEAVFQALKKLNGSYAFCVISEETPDQIIAARNGSPLIIGVGQNENFVASDVPAILEYTKKVIYLNDLELAVISKKGVKVFSLDGTPVKKEIKTIEWNAEEAQKGGYQHYMLKEIEEQPEIIQKILKARLTASGQFKMIDEGKLPEEEIRSLNKIIIQACGTSWHSGLTAKYLFEEFAGLPCEVDVSSEFRYRKSAFLDNTLLMTISQSGETIDALMGIRKAREKNLKIYSLCNVVGSTITRESDCVTYLLAGPEISVASTKAYTAQLTTLFLLSFYFGLVRKTLSPKDLAPLLESFHSLPNVISKIIESRNQIKSISDKYASYRDFIFLARGYNFPNALEGALKIKEVAYLHATGHPAGEMKHGPIALIDNSIPIVCVMPDSSTYEKMLSNVREVAARNGVLIGIVTKGDKNAAKLFHDYFEIPKIPELFSPFAVVIFFQYLAYFVAVARGLDVDQPRNLAKSVTVE